MHGTQMPVSLAVSTRWSGYVVTGAAVAYTSITGTWVEPPASCPSAGTASTLSAVWVGLGGYRTGSNILAQIGTDANCSAAGKPAYFAWFELLPDVAHTIDGTVYAGDTITSTVAMLKANLVELRVENRTRHWTVTRKISWGLHDISTAEWIVEAPYSCVRFKCQRASLTNFGSLSIYDIGVVGNGLRGTLASPDWTSTPLRLVPCVEEPPGVPAPKRQAGSASVWAGATPGGFSPDGRRFRISWVPATGTPPVCVGGYPGTPRGSPSMTIR